MDFTDLVCTLNFCRFTLSLDSDPVVIKTEQGLRISLTKLTLTSGIEMRTIQGQKPFSGGNSRIGNHSWKRQNYLINQPGRLSKVTLIHFQQTGDKGKIRCIEV